MYLNLKLSYNRFSNIFLGIKLLEEGKSCSDENSFKGKISLSMCAEKCDGSASLFAYALNGKSTKRCSPSGCNCYCITGASTDGTCKYYENGFYNVYAYRKARKARKGNLPRDHL